MTSRHGGVVVAAPASVSNVGPGFDAFGFAMEAPVDVVEAWRAGDGVRIESIEGDDGRLPREADRNTAAVAARSILQQTAVHAGVALRIEKGLAPCSGLGSSAASAVAGAVATMRLLEREGLATYDDDIVLEAALAGEAIASGQSHADNVAPSLLGGFTIVQSVAPPTVARFEPALQLWIAAVLPDLEIATKDARAVLPVEVPLHDAVSNWANAAALVAGLLTNDASIVARSMVDVIVEPCRAKLIPGFAGARTAALTNGAMACSISGAGPTVFAMCLEREEADRAARAIAEVFESHDLAASTHVSRISPIGARVL